MKYTYIITAGGIGKRMGTNLPKQFLEIGGRPVLLRTLEHLFQFDSTANFILTLPSDWHNYWREQLIKYKCSIQHTLVAGGKERFHSIFEALKEVNTDIVAIHDGVRPFVSFDTLARCCNYASQGIAVIPAINPTESLRKRENGKTVSVNRNDFVLVQTPQYFQTVKLKEAYTQDFDQCFTDDASVYEKIFEQVEMVEGNRENIKLTEPIDLQLAEIIVNKLKY